MTSALAGSAIGVLLTAFVALLVWLGRVPGDVEEHDRLTRDRDEDLATWVADEKLRVDLERDQILKELAARNAIFSGDRLWKLAKAKERALHAYRDQERQAYRFSAGLAGRERHAHRVYRRWTKRPFVQLTTPERARPILDLGASPRATPTPRCSRSTIRRRERLRT